jgi:hypothetical protein
LDSRDLMGKRKAPIGVGALRQALLIY